MSRVSKSNARVVVVVTLSLWLVSQEIARAAEPAAASTAKGLCWLAERQLKNGAFSGVKPFEDSTAVTALAGWAFIESGSTPKKGAYANEVRLCRNHILSMQQEDGFIRGGKRSTMYEHAYATMFLARCAQVSKGKKLRAPISKAAELIIRVQHEDGGWRYRPAKQPGDVSVTSCQVAALRMADEARIGVPDATFSGAKRFLSSCHQSDGGFAYIPGHRSSSGYARSAAALSSLQACGSIDKKLQESSFTYLMGQIPKSVKDTSYFFYGGHYAVQAARRADEQTFKRVSQPIAEALVKSQRDDGSWVSNHGADYATAMACLILQTKR